MTLSSRIKIAVVALIAACSVTFGAGYFAYQAQAEPAQPLKSAGRAELGAHPYRDSLVAQLDAGSGSAAQQDAVPAPALAASSGSAAEPAPIADPLTELAALKAKYEALKAAKSGGSSKDLLWFAYAALAAAVIRTLLSAIKTWRGDKPTGWVKWAALGLAVPLALLTYYAAGAGLWAAIVMAGAGPGAVIVNELSKKKAPASS